MNLFPTIVSFLHMHSDTAILFLLIAVFNGCFFLWMVVDCALNESPENNLRLVWLLIIIFVPLGSFIYYFVRKRRRACAAPSPPLVPETFRQDYPHCGASPSASSVLCPVCGGSLRLRSALTSNPSEQANV